MIFGCRSNTGDHEKCETWIMDFQPMYFVVESIDGDYTHLRYTDEQIDEPKLVARVMY